MIPNKNKQTRLKQLLFVCAVFFINISYAQLTDYDYKRELTGVNQEWHQVVLPNTIFEKTQTNLNDIRIYKNDSTTVPYLLEVSHDIITQDKINFKALNKVQDAKYSYVTYKVLNKEAINQIKLQFDKKNYDFTVLLQGSTNQRKWYDIKSARVLSIAKAQINYSYNTLNFTNATYPYYRIRVPSKKVKLVNAYLYKNTKTKGAENSYKTKSTIKEEDKNTIITLNLKHKVPVSKIALTLNSDFDYYRPIQISYVSDSVQSPKGWIYNYETLYRGTLSSLEKPVFEFSARLAKELKITINNQDNETLAFGATLVSSKKHRLIAHFKVKKSEQSHYFLAYGNKKATKAHYDLAYFKNKIPKQLKTVTLGEEISIKKAKTAAKNSFLSNEKLLWGLLLVLVLFIGRFTLKMLQKPNNFDDIK